MADEPNQIEQTESNFRAMLINSTPSEAYYISLNKFCGIFPN